MSSLYSWPSDSDDDPDPEPEPDGVPTSPTPRLLVGTKDGGKGNDGPSSPQKSMDKDGGKKSKIHREKQRKSTTSKKATRKEASSRAKNKSEKYSQKKRQEVYPTKSASISTSEEPMVLPEPAAALSSFAALSTVSPIDDEEDPVDSDLFQFSLVEAPAWIPLSIVSNDDKPKSAKLNREKSISSSLEKLEGGEELSLVEPPAWIPIVASSTKEEKISPGREKGSSSSIHKSRENKHDDAHQTIAGLDAKAKRESKTEKKSTKKYSISRPKKKSRKSKKKKHSKLKRANPLGSVSSQCQQKLETASKKEEKGLSPVVKTLSLNSSKDDQEDANSSEPLQIPTESEKTASLIDKSTQDLAHPPQLIVTESSREESPPRKKKFGNFFLRFQKRSKLWRSKPHVNTDTDGDTHQSSSKEPSPKEHLSRIESTSDSPEEDYQDPPSSRNLMDEFDSDESRQSSKGESSPKEYPSRNESIVESSEEDQKDPPSSRKLMDDFDRDQTKEPAVDKTEQSCENENDNTRQTVRQTAAEDTLDEMTKQILLETVTLWLEDLRKSPQSAFDSMQNMLQMMEETLDKNVLKGLTKTIMDHNDGLDTLILKLSDYSYHRDFTKDVIDLLTRVTYYDDHSRSRLVGFGGIYLRIILKAAELHLDSYSLAGATVSLLLNLAVGKDSRSAVSTPDCIRLVCTVMAKHDRNDGNGNQLLKVGSMYFANLTIEPEKQSLLLNQHVHSSLLLAFDRFRINPDEVNTAKGIKAALRRLFD